jgi:hypothetical protein
MAPGALAPEFHRRWHDMPHEFEARQHAIERPQPLDAEVSIEPQRTSAHAGGPECDSCRSELRARGVRWWIGCDLHGIADCPICHRHPGQCDYGTCVETATTLVTSPVTNEIRRMCEGCAEYAALTGWTPVEDKVASAAAGLSVMPHGDQPGLPR